MGTGVEEGPQHSVFAASHHHRDTSHDARHDVAGLGHVPRPGDHLRGSPEEDVLLKLEARRVDKDRSVTNIGALAQISGPGDRVGNHPPPESGHLR